MKRQSSLFCFFALAWFGIIPAFAHDSLALTEIVRKTMTIYFSDPSHSATTLKQTPYQKLSGQVQTTTIKQKPSGVFVTLSKNGKARACWGSIHPQYKTVEEATIYATLGALTKEYRFKPISKTEWPLLKPQVTVIKAIEPIHSLQGQNPLRDGLMLRQNMRSGLILPGEAKDANYQLLLCKLKAGVRPGQKFQLYRIIADVYQ
jgi:AMMECR1 domain-containing protein